MLWGWSKWIARNEKKQKTGNEGDLQFVSLFIYVRTFYWEEEEDHIQSEHKEENWRSGGFFCADNQ